MAEGGLILTNEFNEYFKIIHDLKQSGFLLDLDSVKEDSSSSSMKVISSYKSDDVENVRNDETSGIRCWFERNLSIYLKEMYEIEKVVRPLPVILGNGENVDLFRLFCVVRKHGGYRNVTEMKVWGAVGKESGLWDGIDSSVKLVYMKYLVVLEKWVSKVCGKNGIDGVVDLGEWNEKLCSVLVGLEEEFSGFVREERDDNKKGKVGSEIVVVKENGLELIAVGDDGTSGSGSGGGGGDKCDLDDDEDVVILDDSVVDADLFSRKRKKEERFLEMLNWVMDIAKNPGGSSEEKLAEVSMNSDANEGLKLQGLALSARKVRLHGFESGENSLSQKKQKVCPSIYDDQVKGRLRCSERLHSRKGRKTSHLHSSSESAVTSRNGRATNTGTESDVASNSENADPFDDRYHEKYVAIGTLHQAEIPEWVGEAYVGDPKWLGTQTWPLIDCNQNSIVETESIGKGREDSCGCQLPGSVHCVRFHIAEKRMKLKLEIGTLFYKWRFHSMGEDVALSWTREEEKRVKAMVRLNPPSLEKCFWDEAVKIFQTKTWKSLVSYYFNVFLLRCRSFQNRVTPDNIDSDDDDSDIESASNGSENQNAGRLPGPVHVSNGSGLQEADRLPGSSYVRNGPGHQDAGRLPVSRYVSNSSGHQQVEGLPGSGYINYGSGHQEVDRHPGSTSGAQSMLCVLNTEYIELD
ncbi:AT-rich interactive domain-containing protein 1-like [Papaver somniferum]|uniref:AT-rich interactive domain-containing protein 1-like n=1 Tax=Papaver somniferum TaxID=3469 RepID=UPI000E6FE778|nr:AT-rich interactive domain-containing protein 1-like [Papaver somniferum]